MAQAPTGPSLSLWYVKPAAGRACWKRRRCSARRSATMLDVTFASRLNLMARTTLCRVGAVTYRGTHYVIESHSWCSTAKAGSAEGGPGGDHRPRTAGGTGRSEAWAR